MSGSDATLGSRGERPAGRSAAPFAAAVLDIWPPRTHRMFGVRLFQKLQKSLTGFRVQFLGIQRPIMIWICGTETLLDYREIFVLCERSIVVRIGSGQLLLSQSA